MKIITTLSRKGGVGKTTISMNLAIAAEEAGYATVVLDVDGQASAAMYADRRYQSIGNDVGPVVTSLQVARLKVVLEQARRDSAEICFIDTPARAEAEGLEAVKVADLTLVPCQPSAIDISALDSTYSLLEAARKTESAVGIVSMQSPTPSHKGSAQELVAILEDLGLTVCPVNISLRNAFKHASVTGHGVVEFEPAGKAAEEVRHLWRFVCDRLSLAPQKAKEVIANG